MHTIGNFDIFSICFASRRNSAASAYLCSRGKAAFPYSIRTRVGLAFFKERAGWPPIFFFAGRRTEMKFLAFGEALLGSSPLTQADCQATLGWTLRMSCLSNRSFEGMTG